MAYTAAQVAALEKAIATGTLQVRYGDRSVTYRSLDEMQRLLTDMRDEVQGRTRTRQYRMRTNKGF